MADLPPLPASVRKVCVLLPDYSTSTVDYQHYDPPRNLSAWLPDVEVDHVFLNKLTTYRQLKALSGKGYDIFVSLCEGYLEWTVPSVDVIYFLEQLGLPFTGPSSLLYDPSKELMKYVAYTRGVDVPRHTVVSSVSEAEAAGRTLPFPLFVKPAKSGDSLGVDEDARVVNMEELVRQVDRLLPEFPELLVEEYISGREFTVLVVRNPGRNGTHAYRPVEYQFPEGQAFKTYALKTSSLHPGANVPVMDEPLSERLKEAAREVFEGFGGVGYARLDFRMNEAGRLCFLEINFTCSVFYPEGYEGSADHILKGDGEGRAGFLQRIIAEGLDRHQRNRKKYRIKGSPLSGYGIYAAEDLPRNTLVFRGEERAQRLATRGHVEKTWGVKDLENFRRYAYPVSQEVFLLWDENPAEWAPQNHRCEPNTAYRGLDVIALRDITEGEELTLDYADFLDTHMEPFTCTCGSPHCRGQITGKPLNSVTRNESEGK